MSASAEARASVEVVPVDARSFQRQPAGIVSRVVASAIDLGLGLAILGGLYAGWAALLFLRRGRDFTFPTVSWPTAITILGVIMIAFFAVSWRGSGRTPGDRILGLRVVTTNDARLGMGRALVRALLAVAFPLLLGWVAFSRQQRSVQDLIVGTKVIYDWRTVSRSRDAVGTGVDVAPVVADESDEGHPEASGGLDRQA